MDYNWEEREEYPNEECWRGERPKRDTTTPVGDRPWEQQLEGVDWVGRGAADHDDSLSDPPRGYSKLIAPLYGRSDPHTPLQD